METIPFSYAYVAPGLHCLCFMFVLILVSQCKPGFKHLESLFQIQRAREHWAWPHTGYNRKSGSFFLNAKNVHKACATRENERAEQEKRVWVTRDTTHYQ